MKHQSLLKLTALSLSAVLCLNSISSLFTQVQASETESVFDLDQFQLLPAAKVVENAEKLAAQAESTFKSGQTLKIQLSDGSSTASTPGVSIKKDVIIISAAGIYEITGSLSNGQIVVETKGNVALILNHAVIRNEKEAAITISKTDHCLIYLAEESTNELQSGEKQAIADASENEALEEAEGAALYSKNDLSIGGSGKLTVGGYVNNGIATKDALVILSGELDVEAVNHGIKGKDSVTIVDGKITITSGKDGVKATNEEEENLGRVDVLSGDLTITSFGDGIQAEQDFWIQDGSVVINAGDVSLLESISPMSMPASGMTSMPSMPAPSEGWNDNPFGIIPDSAGKEEQEGAMDGQTMPSNGQGMFPQDQGSFGPGNQGGMGPGTGGMNGGHGGMGGMRPGFPSEGMNPDGTPGNGFDPSTQKENGWGHGGMNGQGGMNGWNTTSNASGDSKGIKAGGTITISGGTITVSSDDDSIHSETNVTVEGGTLTLSSCDDAVHAEEVLTVFDGELTVVQAYEGLEGHEVYLHGGTISVTTSDDGINAGGGSSSFGNFAWGNRPAGNGDPTGQNSQDDQTGLPVLQITGGTIYVNAQGDGLDSNGDLIVDGGLIIVDGPTNSGNGALDSGTENGGMLVCNGGTILAIGASGMAECFNASSAQRCIMSNLTSSYAAGTPIQILDEKGNVLFEHVSAKSFNSIVFSCPELTLGEKVTLKVGENSQTVTVAESYQSGGFGWH